MSRSIRWRMVTIFVLLVVIVMMVSGTWIVFRTRDYEQNLIEEALLDAVNGIQISVKTDQPITEIKSDAIEVISQNEATLKNMSIYLLDNQGAVVYTQAQATAEEGFYTFQVMSALAGNDSVKFDELHPSGEGNYIGCARSISKDEEVVFVVYLVASTQIVQQKINNTVIIITIAVLLAIVLSVILAFVFSNFLTKPLYALSLKAREMATGELDKPMEVISNDEIGALTTNFNKMAFSLNETLGEIASEKNKMETVITHMTDGILVFDNFGIVIHKNPAAIRMLKLGHFMSYKDIFGEKTDVEYLELLKDTEFTTKKINIFLDEEYFGVDFAKYIDNDGTVLGVISVIQDITEHKKLEKIQKDFVANVSHELRTPLTTIKSYTETLLEGAVDDFETTNQFLKVINNESDRMTDLVQDLLELSKIDNQKEIIEEEIVDLTKLVSRSVENYKIHTDKKYQELAMESTHGEYIVIGDAKKIEQVLKNILSNAAKYSENHASINVKLSSNLRYHKISVSDTGLGIPEDDLEHIFDRFYRVDKARSREMGGTGLGLAIAKEIMELHNGKLTVKSKLNEGTTFTLYFPIHHFDDELNVI